MKRTEKMLSVVLAVLMLFTLISGVASAADKKAAGQEVTITGTVSDGNQIVAADGETYGVTENEKGQEVGSLLGMKVQVMGTVFEQDGQKVIEVNSYEIMKK